jgi:hypothetical protein
MRMSESAAQKEKGKKAMRRNKRTHRMNQEIHAAWSSGSYSKETST